ncbi:MAG TPA: hypothetical protein VM123_20390 [archaeon]|nr:hypothetical protein [archaeon]
MKIRCPQCQRHFEYDPAGGPAHCPYDDCGWSFQGQADQKSPPVEAQPELLDGKWVSTGTQQIVKGGGKALVGPDRSVPSDSYLPSGPPQVNYIRCPGCRTLLLDDSDSCPVCGLNLHKAFREREGIRAIFDLSGDITFTPRMVAFLFLATLAAILTFTWILSSKGKTDDYSRLEISQIGEGSGRVDNSLQGISFSQLKNEFLDPKNTDLRKDVLQKKSIGQRVIWSGLVKKVSAQDKSYQVDIVMEDPDSRSFVTLDVLRIPNNEKMIVNISRGQTILFSGKIDRFDTGGATDAFDYFRIMLKDGIILK